MRPGCVRPGGLAARLRGSAGAIPQARRIFHEIAQAALRRRHSRARKLRKLQGTRGRRARPLGRLSCRAAKGGRAGAHLRRSAGWRPRT